MGELSSALDGLTADDLHTAFSPQLLDRLHGLLIAQNRPAAEITRTVRECELTQASEHDGAKTMQSWLRGHGHLSPAAASRLVATGRALEHLPAVAAGFADGVVTAEQVAVIAPVAKPEHLAAAAAQDVDMAGVEAALVQVAATRPYTDLAKVVHHYLARLDPDGPEPDPTEDRSLSLAKHPDGRLSGRFELDATGGEKVQSALESILQAGRCAADTRTRAQQLGDALVQLADNAIASGTLPFLRTVKPHVVLTIPVDDFVDPATGPGAAQMGFGATTISAAAARWLACDGDLSWMRLDPTGRPLNVGRTKRVVPPHIRRAVEVRDGHCVFAGCHAPTHWCDVHQVAEWDADHGETSEANSALLCERHHTKAHHGFRVERQPDGTWHTYRPDGTQILIHPPLRV
jgi:hypothetical protein